MQNHSDRFEATLHKYFHSQEPDPGFLAQLSASLDSLTDNNRDSARLSAHASKRLSWRYALAISGLLLLTVILIIGPDKVLAQIEHWIGYVPGLGEVNLEGTRGLTHPVIRTQGDITFSVVNFIAAPDQTLVRIQVNGPGDENLSVSAVYVLWGDRHGLRMTKAQTIPVFPACAPADNSHVIGDLGYELQLTYEPLPADVDQVRVVWQPYGVIPGVSPLETWTLELQLEPVEADNLPALIQPAYAPESAVDTHYGIEMTIDRVFAGSSRTVIDASIAVPEGVEFPAPGEASLATNTGQSYIPCLFPIELDQNPVPVRTVTTLEAGGTGMRAWPVRWQFEPIDNRASSLSLTVEYIYLTYDASSDFVIDIGKEPAVGTVIPLDISLTIDGFPIHIDQVRIVTTTATEQEVSRTVTALEFDIDSPLEAGGRRLSAIWFSSRFIQGYADPYLNPQTGLAVGRLTWNPTLTKDGVMTVRVDRVVLDLRGPWLFSWDVPFREP